jgi:exopolysaccharide/PEP-CTERM locus tyrosine autokinase
MDPSLIEKAIGRLSGGAADASAGADAVTDEDLKGPVSRDAAPAPPRHSSAGAAPQRAALEGQGGQADVQIDLAHLRRRGFVTPDGERTAVAEEFRTIKRPLLANAFGSAAAMVENGNLIMVTSARAGEGKTFTAINLAISIAMELEKTVLLVDTDVGRANVHKVLDSPEGPGLIDLLLDDKLDVADVMLTTSIPKLRLIPMGRYHPHATELLAGAEMLRLTKELASRYPDRVVIFDAPPLLVTTEAVVVAGLMGQIVFVVQSERTPQSAVRDALELLDQSKPIGLVLNKTVSGLGTYGYGYGYRYGYAAGGKE